MNLKGTVEIIRITYRFLTQSPPSIPKNFRISSELHITNTSNAFTRSVLNILRDQATFVANSFFWEYFLLCKASAAA